MAKPGPDGHNRGAKVIARAFRDASFEVIYTGLFQMPEMVASANAFTALELAHRYGDRYPKPSDAVIQRAAERD